MKKKLLKTGLLMLAFVAISSAMMAQSTVWNPAANPDGAGLWSEAANWTGGEVPNGDFKVVFNVPEAQECVMDIESSINQLVMGDNNPGDTLRIVEGGDLSTGEVWSAIGYNNTATVVADSGGVITFGQHLWVGFKDGSDGTVVLNGGTVNVSSMIGIGWDGGKGSIHVNGGLLNLANIHPDNSISDESVIDITKGKIIIAGDHKSKIENYVAADKITAYDGEGTVRCYIEDDNTVVIATPAPGGSTVWNPSADGEGDALWSDWMNWTDGNVPEGNKVVFNVPDARECVVNIESSINQLVMGDNNPGDTLRIIEGGDLTTGETWSAIGYNDIATMVVDSGGIVSFGQHLWVGLAAGSDGTVELNGGTVNVSSMIGIGWDGGKGSIHVNGGLLNLANIHPDNSISDESVIDITKGKIIIAGNHKSKIDGYAADNKITGFGGEGTVRCYIEDGNTVVVATPAPAGTTVWNPSADGEGAALWSDWMNWTDENVPEGNKVVLNVPETRECVMNIESSINQLVMGDNNPGDTLRIVEGGDLTTGEVWSAIGYNNSATVVVDSGGVITFGQHLWIGFKDGSDGTVVLNGGTVNVSNMIGIGWDGGKGSIHVDGGLLNLANIHPDNSISDESVIDITNGQIDISGDQESVIEGYISSGKITAFDGTGTVIISVNDGVTSITATEEKTDIQDLDIENLIYPNPASSHLYISSAAKIDRVEIYNMDGSRVSSQNSLTTESIDVSELNSGTYIISLFYDKSNVTIRKFVKK